MSPGTTMSWAYSSWQGRMDAVAVPSSFIIEETSAPKPFSISSVWFLERAGSVTVVGESAYRPASRMADFTWAEATLVV